MWPLSSAVLVERSRIQQLQRLDPPDGRSATDRARMAARAPAAKVLAVLLSMVKAGTMPPCSVFCLPDDLRHLVEGCRLC